MGREQSEISKGKCRVLHLRRNDHMHQYRLGADLLGSSSAEKELGLLVDNKLSISPAVCPCGQEGQSNPGLH